MTQDYSNGYLFSEEDMQRITLKHKPRKRRLRESERPHQLFPDYNVRSLHHDKLGFHLMSAYRGEIPEGFIELDDARMEFAPKRGVLCNTLQRKLSYLMKHPKRYIKLLRRYTCVVTPHEWRGEKLPLGIVVGVCQRSHNVSCFFQEHGIPVIPTVQWGDERSYDICFSGYEPGGVVMVSTEGLDKDDLRRKHFVDGFPEMLKRLSPHCVLIYGKRYEWLETLFPAGLLVRFYQHKRKEGNYGK